MTRGSLIGNVDDVGFRDATIDEPKPPLLHRITQQESLQRIDYAVAFVLLLAATPRFFHTGFHGYSWSGAAFGLALGAAVPIAMRRRWPIYALGVATVSLSIATVIGQSFAPDPLIAIPMYQVAAVRERRESIPALAIAGFALLISAAVGSATHPNEGSASFSVLLAIAAWFVGDAVRVRRAYTAGLAEQEEQRARETAERAQRGVAEERLRIARELHDVVAHSLSVIAVQSGVGSHVIDEHPEQAKQALAAVETTSRSALDELRRLLGVLRREDADGAELSPTPSIADLRVLADQIRQTGIPVDLRIDEAGLQRLPSLVELSVYRIVQEALTNVVKHAPGAATRVEIRRDRDEVIVEVTDDGPSTVAPYLATPVEHHGIMGMRERAALFNGSLEAGPRPGGGFRVFARIPVKRDGE
jgi:signal transduction histidine kinase